MKSFKTLAVLLLAGTLSVVAQKKEVNVNQSEVQWTGKKIGGSHNGEVKIKSAYLVFKKDQLEGGEIVIDMTTITNTDLEDEGYNQKLVGHLKSQDFFGVEKYPVSKFIIEQVGPFINGKATISGTLSIKGKAHKITFDIYKEGVTYTAQLNVDRSKYDVRYGSNSFFDNLGDKAIDDIFILDIKMVL